MTIEITAIIPSHRRTVELERALRSVLAQRQPPLEILIVADGPDTLQEEIKSAARRAADQRVRLLANRRAGGPSGARNHGAAEARGDWLAFLDDDDEWLPSYLEETTQRIVTRGLDAIATDLAYEWVGVEGNGRTGRPACAALDPQAFLTRNGGMVGSNLMLRRDLFLELGGFDESLPFAEDMEFGLRLSLRGGVRYEPLHLPLVRAYQHRGPRLCTPRTDVVRTGVRRFYELHAHRMTPAQRAEYDDRMYRLWGVTGSGLLNGTQEGC